MSNTEANCENRLRIGVQVTARSILTPRWWYSMEPAVLLQLGMQPSDCRAEEGPSAQPLLNLYLIEMILYASVTVLASSPS